MKQTPFVFYYFKFIKIPIFHNYFKGSFSSLEAGHSSLEGLDDTGICAAFFVRYYLGHFM